MHKKFIALIIAAAVAVTGISASQARAADTGDILTGLAAIAILGAAVNHYTKDKREDKVERHYNNHVYQSHKKKRHKAKPLPKRVKRYNIPQRCLRTYEGYGNRPLLGTKCLSKHYKHANSLPQQCKVGFWNGHKVKRAYEPACLRHHGYRVVY